MLAGLLVDKVTQAGTDRETYLALQRLGVLGDAAAKDRYVSDLVDWLDLDPRAAAELADGLVAAGLATAGQQTVTIADDGAQLRAKIAGSISAVTAPIYESLSSSDVETTVRTLRYLTTRVRATAPRADPADPAEGTGRTLVTTRNLPDSSDAARHGAGDADLTIMLAAHAAFRRDLAQLAQAAAFADLPDPGRRASVQAGWELFKRQLHLHHTAEDAIVWPALRERLPRSDHAQSVLDAMEAEHQQIDPLLAAVDDAFARAEARAPGRRARDRRRRRRPRHVADRPPGARGARRPAAHRRGAHQRRVAPGGVQDRPPERIVGRRRDVRLAGRRGRPRPGRRRDRHAPAARAAGLPRHLEAALQPNLALVKA